jgi:hypothetical protein
MPSSHVKIKYNNNNNKSSGVAGHLNWAWGWLRPPQPPLIYYLKKKKKKKTWDGGILGGKNQNCQIEKI